MSKTTKTKLSDLEIKEKNGDLVQMHGRLMKFATAYANADEVKRAEITRTARAEAPDFRKLMLELGEHAMINNKPTMGAGPFGKSFSARTFTINSETVVFASVTENVSGEKVPFNIVMDAGTKVEINTAQEFVELAFGDQEKTMDLIRELRGTREIIPGALSIVIEDKQLNDSETIRLIQQDLTRH